MPICLCHFRGTVTGVAIGILAAAIASGVASCDREERQVRADPASEQTVPTEQARPPLPGTQLRTAPPVMQSYRPVKRDYESNAYAISEGQRLFNDFNCVGCHAHGGGGIGPALMDAAWLHGWRPEDVYATIVEGRPNGMPAFGDRIPNEQVWQLVAYVRSLSGISASSDAAPGRDEHMSTAPPPNSVARQHPVVSTTDLEDLRQRQQEEFAREGWLDPRSGTVRVPDAVVQKVGQDLTRGSGTATTNASTNPTTAPATRPATAPASAP